MTEYCDVDDCVSIPFEDLKQWIYHCYLFHSGTRCN